MGNSPLSKMVPAVNESSESCSALQAYKALAFRNGVLCGEGSLFNIVCNHESRRELIVLLPFPCKPPSPLSWEEPGQGRQMAKQEVGKS